MCPQRREKLLHQSDFTSESKCGQEGTKKDHWSFRRDGYYHIGAKQTGAIKCVWIPIADCKVSVDAQFTDHSYQDALCGIVFRVKTAKDGRWDKLYLFSVQWIGSCGVYMYDTDKWVAIVDYKRSDLINRKPGTNALAVEMVGDEITGSVNGHVLVHATDRRLVRGDVGLIVSATKEYYEARFRNFRLYSIEKGEEALIMPAPMPTPPRRPTASVDDGVTYTIEKVTVPSIATAPPAEKPRVAEPAASAQRPPDVRTYLEGILTDAGMTDLTADLREEMIQELTSSLNVFIISEIIDHMPSRHLEAFTRLHEQNRPQAEVNRFIEEHMPNARQVFAEIFEKFRRQYGGKSGR